MGRKLKSQTKPTARSRKKTPKKAEIENFASQHQAEVIDQDMHEGAIHEGAIDEEKPIVIREREAVQEVLETVAKMPYPGVGLRTIAGILRGETRANWLSYIARTESWGVFFPNPLPVVENFIKELVRIGYLEGTHFVRLTERGQRVLENQETPAVRRRLKLVSKKIRPLLWKLLLLRARLVNEHKAPGLFKDQLVLQILENQPTTLEELRKLKGVGKFIAQKLGQEIVQIIRSFQNMKSDGQEN
ncbi:MAG: HRDC domain-containing protein [Armatimonadetes bacterium]|nr:HRDC domain-containing protein [Armatimonadota bacterium]MDW8028988.1 RQC domain-containing protein [Armatimonadota bacterium]